MDVVEGGRRGWWKDDRWVGACLPSQQWNDGDVGGRSHGRIHVVSLPRRRWLFASFKSCLSKSAGGDVVCCVYVITGELRMVCF